MRFDTGYKDKDKMRIQNITRWVSLTHKDAGNLFVMELKQFTLKLRQSLARRLTEKSFEKGLKSSYLFKEKY